MAPPDANATAGSGGGDAGGSRGGSGAAAARSANLLHALSGGVAGAVAKTVTAPFARLVILYQVQAFSPTTQAAAFSASGGGPAPAAVPGIAAATAAGSRGAHAAAASAARAASPPGLIEALRRVVASEGVASLWKGNLVTIVHRIPYSSINFYTYEATSRALAEVLPPGADVTRRMGAGGMAGLVACTAAYPLDLVRTRLAAQTSGHYYRGIAGSLARIVRDEGPAGLYRGLGATLVQVVPSLALSFTVYETARNAAAGAEAEARRRRERLAAGGGGGGGGGSGGGSGGWAQEHGSGGGAGGGNGGAPVATGLRRPDPVSPLASLACGCLTGAVTATATFPLDVVRRRMQVEGAGRAARGAGYGAVARSILAARGPAGFYSGITAELAKVVPGVALAYGTYEAMKEFTQAD
ncbi:hypothetical protein Rsub_01767 [Raphidocelis subcapitata]|uniref:Uncharacterized protein n=1 Tax=Raphidocelis subcapitata TaxID=307507 RepID=A0A2V0NU04_9CHLO|nr:hypothetical protein Rsub_01767 [Raphidocelis subcapitata]|eukprot:GBF89050.1 hypothetical protein Rsub_01767 [Raphidocelis subcapitata]